MITEKTAIRRFIRLILNSGFIVSVNDGCDFVVRRSTNERAIATAMMTTGEDHIFIRRDTASTPCGHFHLVYGNGAEDMICDHSDNDTCNSIASAYERCTDWTV